MLLAVVNGSWPELIKTINVPRSAMVLPKLANILLHTY